MGSLSDMSAGWWFVAMATSVIGLALCVYGIRGRRPVPFIFGFVIGSYAFFFSNVWLCLLIGILLIAGFIVVQKRVN